MKRLLSIAAMAAFLLTTFSACAQNGDKSKRPSPPAKVTQTIASGANISIDYSQPSVKGRTIGKDLDPKEGEVWRTGANEATVFETDKAVTVNGKDLPAGKYALFTISGKDEWTIIFNKTFNQWGAYDYKKEADVLRVNAKVNKANPFAEKFTFTIDKEGRVSLLWGDNDVAFTVK